MHVCCKQNDTFICPVKQVPKLMLAPSTMENKYIVVVVYDHKGYDFKQLKT